MGSENQENVNVQKLYRGESGEAFSIIIPPGYMNTYIQVLGFGTNLNMNDIVSALKELGVVKGVSRKAVEKVLKGEHGEEPVLIAAGVAPKDGKNGRYEFFFRTDLEKKPKLLENGSVDYQNVEWFEVVKENQKIAEYHPATKGVPGINVLGKELPAKNGKELPALIGANIRCSENKLEYFANIGGRIEIDRNKINISRLFEVEELSLATGNLEFDGSVHVKGNIGIGTVLKATEDIVIDGFVEASKIECGGSIMFRKGMNASVEGDEEGIVTAKDYVVGKFFEGVEIKCEGEIQADYFLNCDIVAKKTLLVSGKKGSIAGGRAYALEGIIARNIGNRVGLKTYLRVGINEELLRDQISLEDKVKQTAKEINQLKHARNEMESQMGKELCFQSERYNKIVKVLELKEDMIEDLYKQSENMDNYLAKVRSAQIVVNTELFDGVTCELNNQRLLPDPVKNVTIKMIGNRLAVFENQIDK